MDYWTADMTMGIVLFLVGVVILNACSWIEILNHKKMKDLRRLSLYGRRRFDSMATVPQTLRSTLLTLTGSAVSLTGLIMLFQSINWTDF